METNKRILLYGNSLILESIGDRLRRCPQFEVTTLLLPLQELQKLFDLASISFTVSEGFIKHRMRLQCTRPRECPMPWAASLSILS